QTTSATFTAFLSSVMVFFFSGSTSYVVSKLFFTSIGGVPSFVFLAIERICPTLERTWKSLPRYFSIVLAFAGDSTMTRFFDIYISILRLSKFALKFSRFRRRALHNAQLYTRLI